MTEPWLALIAGLAGVALRFPLRGVSEGLLRARRLFSWRVRAAASISCGLLFAIVAAVLGLVWELPAYLYLACKRLPNAIVHPSLVVLPVLLLSAAALRGVAGFVVGGLVSLIALLARRVTLRSSIPFGTRHACRGLCRTAALLSPLSMPS